jgi:hypothetical protein
MSRKKTGDRKTAMTIRLSTSPPLRNTRNVAAVAAPPTTAMINVPTRLSIKRAGVGNANRYRNGLEAITSDVRPSETSIARAIGDRYRTV